MNHSRIQRLTLLVFVGSFLFYLPFLGDYGLFDPWETHYSEVARSMVQQDDYISTFWQDGGFFSKPVLTFWLQAIGMEAAGLNKTNDNPSEMAMSKAPEWATRVPIALVAALGIAFLFWLLARFFGVLAGGAGALLLGATPHYALVARQTITDMPFVAFTTCAMALFIVGFLHDPSRDKHPYIRAGRRGLGRRDPLLYISGLFLGFLVLAQYFLMAPRVDASFIAFGHRVEFAGWLVFSPYLVLLADVLVSVYRDPDGKGKLYILLGFGFVGLGILAKGFGALLIPAVVFLLYFLITGEWEKLKRFDLFRGLFVVVAVSFPWHHAMIIRHGGAFFQEYFIHHHFKRAAMGVHGERGLFTYYINQLMFGMFPLIPLLPGALGRLVAPSVVRPKDNEQRALLIIALWAVVSFFLFSFMLTKFHHYILPAVVPL
ncbi:glycosyltransferase family 39 protein, partial [Myxococcota bacterium]|nr:glycosyltransferase family 39 protein [Myxococcota bacterium]